MDGSTVPRTKIKSNRAIPDLFRTRRFEQNRSRGLETLLTWSDPRFKIIIHQNSANFAHFRSTVFTSLFRHQGTILRLSCPKTVPVSQLQLTKTGVKARFSHKQKLCTVALSPTVCSSTDLFSCLSVTLLFTNKRDTTVVYSLDKVHTTLGFPKSVPSLLRATVDCAHCQ